MRFLVIFLVFIGFLLGCQEQSQFSVDASTDNFILNDDQGQPSLEVAAQDSPGVFDFENATAAAAAMGAGWRLPNRQELNKMRRLLHQKRKGNFQKKWYWSTTPNPPDSYWGTHFGNGLEYYNFRYDQGCVRAVRNIPR